MQATHLVPQFYTLDSKWTALPLEGVAGADNVAVPCSPHQGYEDGLVSIPP